MSSTLSGTLLMSVFLDMFDIGLYDMATHVRFVVITCLTNNENGKTKLIFPNIILTGQVF